MVRRVPEQCLVFLTGFLVRVVGDAGRVRQAVKDRDVAANLRARHAEEGHDARVERELPSIHQLHDRRGGEDLRHRGDIETCAGGIEDPEAMMSQPACHVDDLFLSACHEADAGEVRIYCLPLEQRMYCVVHSTDDLSHRGGIPQGFILPLAV